MHPLREEQEIKHVTDSVLRMGEGSEVTEGRIGSGGVAFDCPYNHLPPFQSVFHTDTHPAQ